MSRVASVFPNWVGLPPLACPRCGEALIVFEVRPASPPLCEDCSLRRKRPKVSRFTFWAHGIIRRHRHS